MIVFEIVILAVFGINIFKAVVEKNLDSFCGWSASSMLMGLRMLGI